MKVAHRIKRPKVGLGVFLFNENYQILMLRRANAPGANTWSIPGGHVEWNESLNQCGRRELMEETGLKNKITWIDEDSVAVTNDRFYADRKHYFTLYLRAFYFGEQQPKMNGPDKCTDLGWFSWDKMKGMKKRLSLPLQHLIEQDYNPLTDLDLSHYNPRRRK